MNRKTLVVGATLMALASTGWAKTLASETEKLSSGVEVEHMKKGGGAKPSAEDTVLVHYHGTLKDGTVFDSSVRRGEPISFPLKRVIPCWTEGVQRMAEGGEAVLRCPAATAYGARGAGPIPPNTDLIFEVKLLSVKKAK